MDIERITLITRNLELLVRALKEEIVGTTEKYVPDYHIDDYDEVFED